MKPTPHLLLRPEAKDGYSLCSLLMRHLRNMEKQWDRVLSSDSSVGEESSFLEYDDVLGEWFQIFRRIVCLIFRAKQSMKSSCAGR
jgi:hypothetical protein